MAVAIAGARAAIGPAAAASGGAVPRWSRLTQPEFRNYGGEQGLPNQIATAVAQDGQDFIWVGTVGGVARWDGYRFRVFGADPERAGSLPDNFIQVLHGDAAGRLWIGSSAGGLARYDPAQDRFVAYGAGRLSHVSVRAIADDAGGAIWVGTDGGLDRLDPASGRVERGLVAGAVRAVLRDRRGRLWVGGDAGLLRRDPGAASFAQVALPGADAAVPLPQCLYEDGEGRIWIGTQHDGAYVIDAAGGAPQALRETPTPGQPPVLAGQPVRRIVETRAGEVWLGTESRGIVAVDLASGQTRRIRHLRTQPTSLPDNDIADLYRDRSGLVWVAGNGGLGLHDPSQGGVLNLYGRPGGGAPDDETTEVSWILPQPDGRIWLGTQKRGIDIVDPAGGEPAALRPDAAHPETALPHDSVLALERDREGGVYIATKRGLYHADAAGRAVRRVRIPGRDPAASTWALLADGNRLWIGGQNDGVWSLALNAGGAGGALAPALARGLGDQRVVSLARGSGDSLWIGTRNGLACLAGGGSVVTAPALRGEFIASLRLDRRGRLWVGTYGGGVRRFDRGDCAAAAQRAPTAWRRELPSVLVNALVEDRAGRMWVSTDSGLATIDGGDGAVRALRGAEGVAFPNYWTGSAALTDAGELLFGGAGGMTIVMPERLRPWTYRPQLALTEWRIDGRPQPLPGPGAPLRVPARAGRFDLEFAALDYSAPGRNRYAYRLEGYDDDWVETDRRGAGYSRLAPGRYRLLLRGSNRDGVWSEPPLALTLEVDAAWYQTLAFRAAVGAALLALLWSALQLRTRLLRQRRRELERMVAARTAELERVSRELERSSLSDPLTGLRNRRFLSAEIDTALAASLRRASAPAGAGAGSDTVFLLVDIDHFKRVNDAHGHAAGDAVLVEFARRLQAAMRESDYVVRWGGEEFLAVARDTERGRAAALAERIRAGAAAAPYRVDGGAELRLSCSIGYACLPFVAAQPRALGWQEVLKLADIALLAAKRAGRDTWVGLIATAATAATGVDELAAGLHGEPARLLERGLVELESALPRARVAAALGGDDRADGAGR